MPLFSPRRPEQYHGFPPLAFAYAIRLKVSFGANTTCGDVRRYQETPLGRFTAVFSKKALQASSGGWERKPGGT